MPTKILAIDDSKTMRLAIKITFAAEDVDVTSVSKGADAVTRATQAGADIVLVDHKLGPGDPSGYEVCKALKSDPATAKIPVIILASNQSGVDQGALASSGADGFIAKPFETQDLIDRVAELTSGSARPSVGAAASVSASAGPVAPPPSAGPAISTPSIKPASAVRAAVAAPARPAMKSVVTPASAKPAASVGAVPPGLGAAPRPTARTHVGMPTPIPKAPPAMGTGEGGPIPIAIPIPFTAASMPTSSMVARLQAAAADAGVDPKVAQVLADLSRDVIERVVWEVVPELAESIIKKETASRA